MVQKIPIMAEIELTRFVHGYPMGYDQRTQSRKGVFDNTVRNYGGHGRKTAQLWLLNHGYYERGNLVSHDGLADGLFLTEKGNEAIKSLNIKAKIKRDETAAKSEGLRLSQYLSQKLPKSMRYV